MAAAAQDSDGLALAQNDFTGPGKENDKKGLFALQNADLFNLLCIPPYKLNSTAFDVETGMIGQAAAYCEKRHAFLLVDPPSDWNTKDKATAGVSTAEAAADSATTGKNLLESTTHLLRNEPNLRSNQRPRRQLARADLSAAARARSRSRTRAIAWASSAPISVAAEGSDARRA